MSALASTGVGAPRSMAACSVQRPSPESDTRLLRSSSVGSRCSAWASRSSSQDLTTLPRRHNSAISAMSNA